MKVVHLAPFVEGGYTGGMQRYVTELVRAQRCAGLDASVYTLRLGDDAHVDALPISGRRATLVWQRTPIHPLLPRDLRAIEADVIHLHSPSPTLEAALLLAEAPVFSSNRSRGYPASAAAGAAHPRLVVTIHNDLPRTTRLQRALGAVERNLLARVLRSADAVLMPHEAFAADVAPKFGLTLSGTGHPLRDGSEHPLSVNGEGAGGGVRLHIVPPGVDHARFRDLALERDPDTVLFVGHVRPEKGLHVLVDAMALLPHRRLEVVAAVSYESKYYKTVKEGAFSRLKDRVSFRENLSQMALEEAYNRAGVVVAPSLGLESWNLTLLEAASTGAPCVRTGLPGLRWADFAVEAPAGDPTALADSIETAISRRKELACWGKQRAHEYSWDRTCRETLAVYMAS